MPSPDVEYLVTLNVSLDIPQRIQLVNDLLINNVTLNDSYRLVVRIIINVDTQYICKFSSSIFIEI